MRALSTLVAIVADDPAPALRRLRDAANLSVELADELPHDLPDRVTAVDELWSRAARHGGSVYTLVSTDPLESVVDAWTRRLTGSGDDLELAIGLSGELPLPDYYLVDPDLGDPAIHWYTDHLHRLAPNRIVVARPTPAAISAALAGLPYGRAFPETREIVESARTYVPLPELTP